MKIPTESCGTSTWPVERPEFARADGHAAGHVISVRREASETRDTSAGRDRNEPLDAVIRRRPGGQRNLRARIRPGGTRPGLTPEYQLSESLKRQAGTRHD